MSFVILDKENLCLYGHPDETWEVNLPAEEVPPELPEPALGINFPRDGLEIGSLWLQCTVMCGFFLSHPSTQLDSIEAKGNINFLFFSEIFTGIDCEKEFDHLSLYGKVCHVCL